MALRDDIRALRDGVLLDLNAIHDYYIETKIAWHVLGKAIRGGAKFTYHNVLTSTVISHVELPAKARGYVTEQLAEATFQQMIALFESFFFDLLRLWLLAYPQNLIGKQVSFKDVLEAPDKNAITLLVVNKELNEILYKRPAD